MQLAQALNNQALTQKNISPKQNDSPNEKFTFRTWMIRLGMNGPEFKTTRAMLMENLEGNTAWKNPELSNRQKDMQASAEQQSDGNAPEIRDESQQSAPGTEQEVEQELETAEEPEEGMSMSM